MKPPCNQSAPSPVKRERKTAKSLFRGDEDACENLHVSPTKQRKIQSKTVIDKRDPYQKILSCLASSSKTNLLFRENEFSQIRQFLDEHLSMRISGSLYISGGPGTGKTFSVTRAIEGLSSKYRFRKCFINCMDCTTPAMVFSKILDRMGYADTPKKVKDSLNLITENIVTPTKKLDMSVLVLDEIDELEKKNQEVLHELFSWPQIRKSKVIIIGISNTLDFTSRSLSRINFTKGAAPESLNFRPYSRAEIKGILKDRISKLESTSIISEPAIELCSRKISALNGDLRQAFSVMEKAVSLAKKEYDSSQAMKKLTIENAGDPEQVIVHENSASSEVVAVSLQHVNVALTEVYGSKMLAVKTGQSSLPTQQQIALCVLLLSTRKGSHKELDVNKCHETMLRICNTKGLDSATESSSDFLNMLQLMEAKGLCEVKKARGKDGQRCVILTVDPGEVERVLVDSKLLRSILDD